MHRRSVLTTTAAGTLLAALPASAQSPPAPAPLAGLLTPYLASHDLPALGAAVGRGGVIIAAGAVGTRRAGTRIPVTIDDRFHIGSCTKAFTALLAGILVDEGRIGWDTTIGARFPEFREGMDPGLAAVTLEQLLSHVGGIPADTEESFKLTLSAIGQDEANLDDMRAWILQQWRAKPLAHPAGTRFEYANLGLIFAGAMLERAAGSTWEELVTARIFDPLGLKTAGIGPQATVGRVDAPLGHALRPDGTIKPMLGGPDGDVPAVYGPAGAGHLSVLDFAAWAGWHAGAGKRGPALVKPETLRRLHTKVIEMARPDAAPGTPTTGAYGHCWGFLTLPWSRGEVMTHNGSNTMNLAMILVQPARDFAFVITTNRGDTKADAALKLIAEALYRQYAPA